MMMREPLYYDRFPSPLGEILAAVSSEGVYALTWKQDEERFVRRLEEEWGGPVLRDPERLRPLFRQLEDYFAGRALAFDLPLDLRRLTPFQREVLEAACRIPPGQTASYGELARWVGRPRAARAVGQAMARNPIPLVIPCHRVIASDGSLGGYGGEEGLAVKAWLLRWERGERRPPPHPLPR